MGRDRPADDLQRFQTALRLKFESEADRYPDARGRITYVFSRLEGRASKIEGQLALWQKQDPRGISRKVGVLQFTTATTLRELLGSTKLKIKPKRALGLIFAYSLLLYHDSRWLPRGWNKDDIVFFRKGDNLLDTEYPFLAPSPRGGDWAKIDHHNQEIMALGILLVEIFDKNPIESPWAP